MKRIALFGMIFLLMLGLIMTACAKNITTTNSKTTSVNKEEIQKQQEAIEQKKRDAMRNNLKMELDRIIQKLPQNGTVYSVYLNLPLHNISYTYNNKPMSSASMIKVFILEMAFNEINNGKLSENMVLNIESETRVGGAGSLQGYGVGTPVKMSTLLHKMIVESDNTATNMLIKYLGMDNINAYMQKRGYSESLLCRRMMDYKSLREGKDNITSVKDLGLFFHRVYSGTAVNPEIDKKMVDILKQQEDMNKIPFYLDKNIVVAHKTGEINAVMNDGGIVYAKQPYILCILTDDAPGYNLAIEQVAKLSKDIYDVIEIEKYNNDNTNNEKKSAAEIQIVDKPVMLSERKKKLMEEYSFKHYGKAITNIVPQAIVIHWTASENMESTYNWFYGEEYANMPGTLNVGSQFVIDKDGTIYRLMPENTLARHAIGYNWCAIGIENVGGSNHKENLTVQQLNSNVGLIKYLKEKYPTIKYVWGHYQQDKAKQSGLYRELVHGYYSGKTDPGPNFMRNLRLSLSENDIAFYEE